MKRKLLYIFSAAIISFTSTGFGFLESSTALHKRTTQSIKTDSVSINSLNISLRNASMSHKEIKKPVNESVTKSIAQWVANAVKNTIEKIMTHAVKVLQSIVMDLIKFFTK